MSDEATLLPCHFCGGEAFVRIDISLHPTQSRYRVGCDKDPNCHGWYGHSRYYATEAEAITAWNTRAPVEYDGWFYLPKPKENIVQYGEQRTEKTEHGYKVTQPVEVIESAIRSWGDELGEYIMKRICEAWSTRLTLGSGTCRNISELNKNGVSGYYFICSECGLSVCASMGIGEIEMSGSRSFSWKTNGKYEFEKCPRCGKVVKQ